MPPTMSGKGRFGPPATYRVTLGYDGARFHGYARQPNRTTVEGVLRQALTPLLQGRSPALAVGGRTDRGVHAVGQVISFKLAAACPVVLIHDTLAKADLGLWIEDVRTVPRWFHARHCACARRYVYLAPDEDLDLERLQLLLDGLAGRRCFSAFARDTPSGQDTHRRLSHASVRRTLFAGETRLRFDFRADSFLRRMVRVLVATSLRAAREGAPPDTLARIAASGDRRQAAWPAPPDHLYLAGVEYDPAPRRPHHK